VSSFDGHQSGTPETQWSECRWLHKDPTPTLPAAVNNLVVLVAHPDDESLGAAGLISFAASQGLPVQVIFASDGEASHPNSPTLPPVALGRVRRAEARAAVEHLAPEATTQFLGLPDGALSAHEDQLEATLRSSCREGTLIISTWTHDRHPDHEACGRSAGRALTPTSGVLLWEFPIWAWHWAQPAGTPFAEYDTPSATLLRFPLSRDLIERKARAIASYPSQTHRLSALAGDEAVVTSQTLEYFRRSFETYLITGASP
jgi:LmbE family N-acetylglucosaminyl deacetylase